MKPSKTKKIIGTSILVLVSLFLLFSAFGKLTGHPTALEMFAILHIPHLRIPLGIIEALVAVLLLIPRTNRIAVLIISGFLGGAILAELFFGMTGAFAGVTLLLVWIGSALRHHTCYCGCTNCQQCHERCSDCKTGTCSLPHKEKAATASPAAFA